MEKSKTKKIELEFTEDNLCKIIRYQRFFQNNLKPGKKIPAKVILSFLELFNNPQESSRKELKKLFKKIEIKTLDRYSRDDEYNFQKKVKGFGLRSRISFEDMVEDIFISLNNYSISSKFYENKNSFIRMVQDIIDGYFGDAGEKNNKTFGAYKRAVIAAYITHEMGFILSKEISELERKEPPNKLLYEAGKYKPKNIPSKQKKS